MNHNKRGQAALEFLTTYGWAFLVILVMIGALSYFGVLDPTKFLPQRCQFGAEMQCSKYSLIGNNSDVRLSGGAFSATAQNQLAIFQLKNGLPTKIAISKVSYKTPEDESYTDCEDEGYAGRQLNSSNSNDYKVLNETNYWAVPKEGIVNILCPINESNVITSGDKKRIQFKIEYNEGDNYDANFLKDLYGEIYANVR